MALPDIIYSTFPVETTWVVGGAVRDRLLQRKTGDIDLLVPSKAKQYAAQLADKAGTSSFVLDGERGVYRVVLPQYQIDIANWQGASLEDDLRRRDFTINAMAVPLSMWEKPFWKKALIDCHGGLPDLSKKIIRQVSDGIYADDPLRLLRAFRIAAEIGFSVDKKTTLLIAKSKGLLKRASPERVRDEFMRLLSVFPAWPVILKMDQCGLLDVVFPEAKTLRATAADYYGKGGVLKHTLDSLKHLENILASLKSWFPKVHKNVQRHVEETVSGYARSAHLKWAVLLHDVGKPATAKVIDGRLRFFEHEHVGAKQVLKMKSRYRWSNDETERYSRLVRHHMRPGNLAVHPEATARAYNRFFRDLGDDSVGMLLVSLGDHLSYLTLAQIKKRNSAHEKTTIKMMNQLFLEKEKVLPPKLLTGYDIMSAFKLKPSPLIGKMLDDVRDAQVDGHVETKDQALRFLKGRM